MPRRLLRLFHPLRHRVAIRYERRVAFTFTRFLRLPTQYEALVTQVVPALRVGADRSLDIVVLGCSVGAEPYSIASVLLARAPGLDFGIRAFDIDDAVLRTARQAAYPPGDVQGNGPLPRSFVEHTFESCAERCTIDPAVRARVSFQRADVLADDLAAVTGSADIVYVQNLLVNLTVPQARRAFAHALSILRPRAALFLDGVPLPVRQRLTRSAGLVPLSWKIRQIHEEVRRLHGDSWPWHYWGVEPLNDARRHWRHRYATIFLTPELARMQETQAPRRRTRP